MSVFTYTARRELAPGTSLLDVVTRDFRLISKRKTRKPITKQNTSLSGSVESILFRSEQSYNCQTGLIEPGSIEEAHIEEFVASVENAESFSFDRFGSIAVPGNLAICIMVSKSITASEQGKKFHRYGFVIREA